VLLAAQRPAEAVKPLEQAVSLFREAQLQESADRVDAQADLRRAATR
jgi:hypothetical protein